MFFDNWHGIWRVVVVGILGYIALVILLRITGNRTLSKMNSFDLVITIAFGSILSSILVDKKVALAEGVVGIALLVYLQYGVTWSSVRWRWVDHLVKTTPTLVFREGKFLPNAMKDVRVAEDEIRTAARQQGIGDLSEIAAVVLETDGSLSVIQQSKLGCGSALSGIRQEQ